MRKALLATMTVALLAFAPAASAAPRLEGWWSFNEFRGSQVAWDWSGQGNHGQLGSTPGVDTNDPTRIAGWFLGGLRFDGNDFVRIPSSTDLEPTKVTVAAWVRGSSSPGQWKYILSKGSNGCDAGSYGLYSGSGGGLAFYISSDGATWTVSPEAGPAVWDGRWHFVAGTFDGSTVRVYVDGAQIGNGTPTSMQIGYGMPGADAYLGAYRGSCDLMITGDLDEVMVWNQALPISDIWNRFSSLLGNR